MNGILSYLETLGVTDSIYWSLPLKERTAFQAAKSTKPPSTSLFVEQLKGAVGVHGVHHAAQAT